MSSMLDSQPVFVQRALAIGAPQASIDPFVASDVNELAKFAFASNYFPGAQNEQPFVDVLVAALRVDPPEAGVPAGLLATLRLSLVPILRCRSTPA